MKTLKIFLASSEELKTERLVIAELITKLNYLWAEYDISIRLVKWEYIDSSMGVQHKQEDYNDYLRQCDMCVVLFWTKFGMYTEIELKTAYKLFCSDSKLKQMAVMFKFGGNVTPELQNFRRKDEIEHPELCQIFMDESHLKILFTQLIVRSIQFMIKNEHESLIKKVRKLQRLMAITEIDDPDYKEYQYELQSTKNNLAKNESFISDLENTSKTY
jgi:hypothetical protein